MQQIKKELKKILAAEGLNIGHNGKTYVISQPNGLILSNIYTTQLGVIESLKNVIHSRGF